MTGASDGVSPRPGQGRWNPAEYPRAALAPLEPPPACAAPRVPNLTRVSALRGHGADAAPMVETIEGWRCIGCGRVDAPQPCIGVCQDKRVELVLAEDYAEMAWWVEQLQEALSLIAHTTPKPDQLEASWLALQARARTLLESGPG